MTCPADKRFKEDLIVYSHKTEKIILQLFSFSDLFDENKAKMHMHSSYYWNYIYAFMA